MFAFLGLRDEDWVLLQSVLRMTSHRSPKSGQGGHGATGHVPNFLGREPFATQGDCGKRLRSLVVQCCACKRTIDLSLDRELMMQLAACRLASPRTFCIALLPIMARAPRLVVLGHIWAS